MTKHVFLYEDLTKNCIPEIISLVEISERVKISYRTLQRKISGKNKYYDPDGNFRISKIKIVQDKRKKNGDDNIKYRNK